MAYIQAHQSLKDHRKILALSDALDIPEAYSIGLCVSLWMWSLDNAPDAILPDSVRAIERAAGWTGESGAFVSAMERVGFLDRTDDALILHDWFDYAGNLLLKREKNAERQRIMRVRNAHVTRDNDVTTDDGHAHVTGLEKSREENQKTCVDVENAQAQTEAVDDTYPDEFEQFWDAYPRRLEKKRALRVWKTRRKEGVPAADMTIAAQRYAEQCRREGRDITKIKHAGTFLGPDRAFEDYIGGVAEQASIAVQASRASPSAYNPQGISPPDAEEQAFLDQLKADMQSREAVTMGGARPYG